MEYTINKLAKIAGVSTRTLRYYDQMDLLKPARISSSGYRVYGAREVDILQQILFYRELGVELAEISEIMKKPGFNRESALERHLKALIDKKNQLERLIENVRHSISNAKGERMMTDMEKFEGFKEQMIADNERQYGGEIRKMYGDEAVNASNAKIRKMTPQKMEEMEKLTAQLNETLKEAFLQGDPASELAQKSCALHKEWLMLFWDKYSKEAHKGLAQMYIDDPRFTKYYDKIAPGCAVFLRDAIAVYCGN